jgi:RNA recognition motif-containing protein
MQGMLHRLSDGSEEEVTVGTKLYVGSLPYTTTDQQLQELFAQHGTVSSAKVISDRYTGRSRGFGFVEMATSEDAQKAIAALNGTQYEGRALVVNEAKPQEKRERSSWGGGGGEGGGRGGGGRR